MKVSISNIAWDPERDEDVASVLRKYGVDSIDIAPMKYFPSPYLTTDAEILNTKNWWQDRGIKIYGMQSLLFGTRGFNVFGSIESQSSMLSHLGSLCRIAQGLGATKLTFGSPKNRDRSGLDDNETVMIALNFFRQLGEIAAKHGVMFCLEPNPVSYGANFLTNSFETAKVVREINHPAIKMQFDTGALAMNGEDPVEVLEHCAELIGHIHASEPELSVLGEGGVDHARMGSALKASLPSQVATVEMLVGEERCPLSAIESALKIVIENYSERAIEVER